MEEILLLFILRKSCTFVF